MEASSEKRAKLEEPDLEAEDQLLFDCLENKSMLENLKSAIRQVRHGDSQACVRLLKVVVSDARACETFSKATCTTRSCIEEEADGASVLVYSLGSLFPNGLLVLEKFIYELEVPDDKAARDALRKLVQFMNTSCKSLKRPEKDVQECKWVVLLAQHLFSQLAVGSKYTIEKHYQNKEAMLETCPCEKGDKLTGEFGDTSIGWPDGWHGSVDICFEDVAIQIVEDSNDENDEDHSAVNARGRIPSDASDYEVKSGEKMDNSDQMLAHCIVNSFLQRKLNAPRMDHYLVPSFGVSKSLIIISFYDSENDVLLQSAEIPLFVGKTVSPTMVVCLWLAMNYRCFCSGITEDMKNYKAEFHYQLGPDLKKYVNTVAKPLPMTEESHLPTLDYNWSYKTRKRVHVNPTMKGFFPIKKR